jgi:hypothetical protein
MWSMHDDYANTKTVIDDSGRTLKHKYDFESELFPYKRIQVGVIRTV